MDAGGRWSSTGSSRGSRDTSASRVGRRSGLTFFIPPLSEVVATLFNVIGTDAFQKARHFPIQQVGTALQAYFDGLSYREAARNIGRAFNKLRSYIPAIKMVFPKAHHLQSQGMSAEVNNNLSERLQGSLREREKVLRGMKSRESGQNYLDGWAIDYNLFRPHMGLKGKTPAQAAGMAVPFKDWQDVAQKVTPVISPPSRRREFRTRDERPARGFRRRRGTL